MNNHNHNRRKVLFGLFGFLGLAVLVVVAFLSVLYFQRSLIYAPYRVSSEEERRIMERLGIPQSAAIDLVADDKTQLRAYWMPARDPTNAPTVLYLHGNGGKIEWGLKASVLWRRHMDVNFLTVSYRGFGCSQGQPDMQGIRKDSQSREDVRKDRIVLFGHSLGGAVALHLAADNPTRIAAARVVFENPNAASIIDPLILDPWNNEQPIESLLKRAEAGLSVPHFLLLSGRKDRIVAPWHMDHLWNKIERGAQGFTVYVGTLCRELCDESRGSDIRQAAGVAMKNAVVAKDTARLQEFEERWMAVDANVRTQMKSQLLATLGASEVRAGTAAAQTTAAISRVELKRNAWPELMEALMTGVHSSNENMRRCVVETIGYICEEIEPTILESQSDKILTAVITGLRAEEPSSAVRTAAAHALYNSLEFARMNFDRQNERDIIMNVVCTATQATDEALVLASFECLVRIVSLYYHLMEPYMKQAVSMLTINSMHCPAESIVLQAIEFWSTVCDIETDLQIAETGDFACLYFARNSLEHLLPSLLKLLPHEDEDDTDEWNKAMAAGTCLSLLAECVKEDIFQGGIILQFVERNLAVPDWRLREAAVMAFGSVMDGPTTESISPFIQDGLPMLLKMMNDSSVAVRDTSAWAIGRVVDFFNNVIPIEMIPHISTVLCAGLTGAPRVAVNCCWSLMSLFVHYGDDSNNLQTSPTSTHFTNVASALFSTAQRQDADDSNLKSAAYQSLANVVLFAPMDCLPAVEKLQTVMVVKFTESQSLSTQIVNADDRMRFSELQSHICTVLQNSLKKLGRPDLHVADQIMTASLSILTNCSKGTELEDVMLLIGTLVSEIESEFTRFAHPFIPLLNKAISNHAEYHLCTVAVGVVGDLARSMNQTLLPFCDDLMRHLLEALQDPSLARTVKPHVISSIGDLSLAVGGSFVKYLPHTMTFFAQAGVITVQDEEDYDEIDFVCDIRESLLEAYTSIVQGFKDDQQALVSLSQYVNQITEFISIVASDPNRSDAMVRAAIGLVGDLVDTYKSQMLPILRNDWLMRFIRQPLDDNSQVSESTLSVVKWTLNVHYQF